MPTQAVIPLSLHLLSLQQTDFSQTQANSKERKVVTTSASKKQLKGFVLALLVSLSVTKTWYEIH